jgi:hypothetical protein
MSWSRRTRASASASAWVRGGYRSSGMLICELVGVTPFQAAHEMLPMTRQRWMRAAVRWCSGGLGAVGGRQGSAGSSSRESASCRRCSRLRVRRALPLARRWGHPAQQWLASQSKRVAASGGSGSATSTTVQGADPCYISCCGTGFQQYAQISARQALAL